MWDKFREEKLSEFKRADVDEEIRDLLELINSVDVFVTLSSCAGRIVVMDMPSFGEKLESVFLGKWHSPPNFDEVLDAVKRGRKTTWLMMHPPIVHIACRDLEVTERLLSVAKKAGFRRSGLISFKKLVVEIASPERLEVVVGIKGKIADENFLKINYEYAVKKLLKSRERMKKFEREFKEAFL